MGVATVHAFLTMTQTGDCHQGQPPKVQLPSDSVTPLTTENPECLIELRGG